MPSMWGGIWGEDMTPHETIEIMLDGHGVKFEREYRFNSARRWRFDWSIPEYKIGIEYEGSTWASGRHTRGAGYAKDCEKYNSAACLGWRVLRYTSDMIRDNPSQIIDNVMTIITGDIRPVPRRVK